MAEYITEYSNDFGVKFTQVKITVYLVIDGVKQFSSYDFEAPYLPQVWKNWCLTPQQMKGFNRSGVCSPPAGQLREARLTLAEGMVLHIPVPWRGADDRFKQFFQEVSFNSGVLFTAIQGEVIGAFFTDRYSR